MKLLDRQFSLFTIPRWICFGLLGLLLMQSCVVPRNAPVNQPFVFKTNINVTGDMPVSEKRLLAERLQNQLDDSLKTRVISYAGIVKRIINPPVFDTLNADRSVGFMRALLNSQGYFNPGISWEADTNTYGAARRKELEKKGQYRVVVNFTVAPGKVMRLDSIGYDLSTPALQQLALAYRHESLLKKNDPFSLQTVSAEIDRLLSLFRNNGYYKLSREDFYAERDTVVAALIDPTLDPFEQIRLLDSLRRKRENPTINVVLKQRPVEDSTRIQQFYVGNVTVYPDMFVLEERGIPKDTATVGAYTFIYSTNRFKLPFIARNIALRPGRLYREDTYFRTINTFNLLTAWQSVDLTLEERYDSVPLVDATLKLYPEKKYSATVDVEASRNVSDFLTTGQLFGLGLNFRLNNRNAFREAIQTSTNARFGIELGSNFIQTLQASLAHIINIPRFVSRVDLTPWISISRAIGRKTIVNLNGAYTDRRDFFQVRSVNASWGYEWSMRPRRRVQPDTRRGWTWTIQSIPINIEYTTVYKTDSLDRLEERIPSYQFAFNDGLIISRIWNVTAGKEVGNKFLLGRGRLEWSGLTLGLIKELDLGDLHRFVKIDGEFKYYINYKKASWAFRAFAGYAYIFGKRDTLGNGNKIDIVDEHNLPFFKAFFGGGPYSMRAWPIRRLGPGSAILYDTAKAERFGNIQLELNAEYRFPITTVAGIKVNSALFVDMGNIWRKEFVKNTNTPIPEASFHLDRLLKDLAIGAGTSLRFDFDFFMIRLDWAYRVKDPAYSHINNGWFHDFRLTNGQFQLGIGYPF